MAKGFFIWRGVCTDVNISSILYPINPAFELNVGSKVYDAFEDKKSIILFVFHYTIDTVANWIISK